MAPCIRILCILLCGIDAARIRRKGTGTQLAAHQDEGSKAGAKEEVTHVSAIVEESWKSRALLEEGCKFDQMPEDNSKKVGVLLEKPKDNSSAFVPASELGPDDYWSAENALGRCRSAKRWRTAKVVIGAPLMILSGQAVLMNYHVYAEALGGMVELAGNMGTVIHTVLEPAFTVIDVVATKVVDGVVVPLVNNVIAPVVTNVIVPVIEALSTGTMKRVAIAVGTAVMDSVPWVTAQIVFTTMFAYMYTFVIVQYLTFAVPAAYYVMLLPFIEVMGAVEVVNSVSIDLAAKFLGHGEKYPSCCCAPVDGKAPSPDTCMLVTSTDASRGRCPSKWMHDAGQCAIPEMIAYSDQTVEGCRCVKATDCSKNSPHQGHAWCEVQPGHGSSNDCGFRMFSNYSKRWDHCRVDGKPLDFATGKSKGADDALATFIPNDFAMRIFSPGANSAFSLGTWVDSNRALTTAKPGLSVGSLAGGLSVLAGSLAEDSQCFAGTPVETLSACARLCLEEGAPNAKTMSKEAETVHKCVAFAWHRALHLCVRLPAFATDAEFEPHISEWNGDGWQNFVSKYHGRDADTVCKANVLSNIRESGYDFVRDKNNGHIYIQCANNENIQKVSCLADECAYKSSWCFVNNNCRSGMPLWLGGCGRLTGSEALKCAGKHGSIIPDNGSDQADDYFSASKSLARCSTARTVRLVKAVISTYVFLWVGEFARLSIVNRGAFRTYADTVIKTTWETTSKVFLKTGKPLLELSNHGFVVAGSVPVVGGFLLFAWGAVVSAFATIYVSSILIIAVNFQAAAILGPIIATSLVAKEVPEVGVDILSLLVGYGPRYPKCCCPDDASTKSKDGSRLCAVVATRTDVASRCPSGWTHDATQCAIPEMIKYSDSKTMGGCQCKEFQDCSSNAPYHGHAWCHVKGQTCGNTAWAGGGSWDYCRIEGEPLAYAQGKSTTTNDALATFIPNEFSRGDLLGPSNPLRLGSWTDPSRAITTAQPGPLSLFTPRECFAAVPVETLGGCATKCLQEGAPNAADMGNNTDKHISDKARPCVAFAYNRNLNLCVRLPAFAADAKYTPMMHTWGGEGWQNFVSKYFGLNLQSSCPAMTLLNIRDRGYAVARDKNNGHLYLRCASTPQGRTQKVSCHESECVGSGPHSTWCFVENKCGGIRNACKYIGRMNVLNCED